MPLEIWSIMVSALERQTATNPRMVDRVYASCLKWKHGLCFVGGMFDREAEIIKTSNFEQRRKQGGACKPATVSKCTETNRGKTSTHRILVYAI